MLRRLASGAAGSSTTLTLMKLMSLTTVKLSVIGALVVASMAVPTWQQTRLQRAQSANAQLRAQETAVRAQETVLRTQATELAALRGEVQRLRKVADDHAELEQLRQWKTQTQSELIRLREMPGVARRANLEVEQLRAQLARQASKGGTNSYTARLMDGLKKAFAQRVESDLAGLTARLHLTPEQTQAVRDILWRHARARLAEEEQRFTGKYDKDEVDRLKKEAGDKDAQIQALLTPDQKAAWPDYKQEVAAKDARWMASNRDDQIAVRARPDFGASGPGLCCLVSVSLRPTHRQSQVGRERRRGRLHVATGPANQGAGAHSDARPIGELPPVPG